MPLQPGHHSPTQTPIRLRWSSKEHKQDDFNFEIVNFSFLDGDVPRSPSYGVYISQFIRFARVCSNVDDFNNRNLFLTAKILKQGYATVCMPSFKPNHGL